MTIDPRYKYHAVSAVSVCIILFTIYFLLGGTREYRVAEAGAVNYDIVGVPYQGKYVPDSARILFEQLRTKITSNEWKGELVEITYLPQGDEEVNQFFGVLLTGRVTQIDGAYQIRKISARSSLQVRLTMHWLVRPGREKVQTMIDGYARENGMEIEDFFLQRYLTDNSVVIEAFVK